jgi:hypothetical protein
MSRLRELAERLDPRREPPTPTRPAAPVAAPAPAPGVEPESEENVELLAQRDRLLEKFTIMQADLGGAFYEMAIRDHVRMDVLTRKAAELQRVDAELLTLERVLEMQRSDAAGNCPTCGAPYGHAVRFCGHCGQSLVATPEAAG